MPEIVNTSSLMGESYDFNDSDKQNMIEVDHVSMVFNMASEQLNSLKEYAIAFARRELRFKEFRALDDISLEVKQGDVFGILGTNGSGKSTLLKIIAGVLDPSEGSCRVHGSIAPLIELGAGFDMELTARENIFLNGALLGYSKAFIQESFDEIVDFAEIRPFLDMPLKNYSSGMVARIAFAIATVIVPEILIVDEVLSVGDFMFQKKCEERIMSLIKEHNVTVLIVSHSNDQIERLCNKAVWIEKGHMRMLGPASDVCKVYRVLGGHSGSGESEKKVVDMLSSEVVYSEDAVSDLLAESRYGVAAKLSSKSFSDTIERLVLVSGENDFDFALGNSLAGALDAGLLVSQKDYIPDIVFQEIVRLDPSEIVILSTDRKSSQTLAGQLSGLEAEVAQVVEENYIDLSIAVFDYGESRGKWNKEIAIAAYKECTGDIISFAPFSYAAKVPLFLKNDEEPMPTSHTEIIISGGFDRLIVLGGEEKFSKECLEAFAEKAIETVRVCGKDAYDANEIINFWIEDNVPKIGSPKDLVVVSFWHPSDAYVAGVFAAKIEALILLEDPDNLDSVAHSIDYIERQEGCVEHLIFVGDRMRFADLDKMLLAKAVSSASANKEM